MNTEYFIAGCLGAVAPEVVRLYETSRQRAAGVSFSLFYWVISVVYACLAGYVASIFPGLTGPFYAFCVGVGFDLIVNKASTIVARLLSPLASGLPSEKPVSPPNDGFARRREAPAVVTREGSLYEFLSLL
jgi:hypothetical protein